MISPMVEIYILYVCRACHEALKLYIGKTGVDPMEKYKDFVYGIAQMSQLLEDKEEYSKKEWIN